MIDLKCLSKHDVGRWVDYTTPHGGIECGRLKSWNDKFAFIVFNCDSRWNHFDDYTAAATNPDDLRFSLAPKISSKIEPDSENG